jgi:Ulp1 family protease
MLNGLQSIFKSDWGDLTQHDIEKLEPGKMANDEIVNFALKYVDFLYLFAPYLLLMCIFYFPPRLSLVRSESDEADVLNLHLFSTFLFSKLSKG